MTKTVYSAMALYRVKRAKTGRQNYCIFGENVVKYKGQSKIGSCKEVLRARAATITRRTLECFRPPETGFEALFVYRPVMLETTMEKLKEENTWFW